MEVKGQILNRQHMRSELFNGLLHILNVLSNILLLALLLMQLRVSLIPAEDASPSVQHMVLKELPYPGSGLV